MRVIAHGDAYWPNVGGRGWLVTAHAVAKPRRYMPTQKTAYLGFCGMEI